MQRRSSVEQVRQRPAREAARLARGSRPTEEKGGPPQWGFIAWADAQLEPYFDESRPLAMPQRKDLICDRARLHAPFRHGDDPIAPLIAGITRFITGLRQAIRLPIGGPPRASAPCAPAHAPQ